MKKLLILLFSIFFLSSPSVFADDISDFEIEGISIGDSLLDYMTEDEILEQIERTKDYFLYLKDPHKYASVYLWKDLSIYDGLQFMVKNDLSDLYISDTNEKYILPAISESTLKNNATNEYLTDKNKNKKYTILQIRGLITYIEDLDKCMQKRDEIVGVLTKMFPDTIKEEISNSKHPLDPSGKSFANLVNFNFDSGDDARVYCNDWEENFRIENNYSEGLSVDIATKEIVEWSTVE